MTIHSIIIILYSYENTQYLLNTPKKASACQGGMMSNGNNIYNKKIFFARLVYYEYFF